MNAIQQACQAGSQMTKTLLGNSLVTSCHDLVTFIVEQGSRLLTAISRESLQTALEALPGSAKNKHMYYSSKGQRRNLHVELAAIANAIGSGIAGSFVQDDPYKATGVLLLCPNLSQTMNQCDLIKQTGYIHTVKASSLTIRRQHGLPVETANLGYHATPFLSLCLSLYCQHASKILGSYCFGPNRPDMD